MGMGAGIALGLAGLAVGAVVGYLLASLRKSEKLQEQTEERVRAEQKASWLDNAEKSLREAFQALASEALRNNSEQVTERTKDQIVAPLEKSLKALDQQVRDLEKRRESAYKGLDEHLLQLHDAHKALKSTTDSLTTALTSSSGARGEWGELQMRRIVELAGMVPHVDFDEQETSDQGRPDMIVRLPNEGIIPVDAKTTMKTYLEAIDTDDDRKRKVKLQAHAAAVRTRIRELAGKQYWKQFERAPDVVVMFVPNEAFLSGAFEGDRDLMEYALGQHVLIATPVTLLALLRTVAFAWQQQQMAENAKEIAAQAKELTDRLGTFIGHLQKSGKGLDSAVRSYNDAIGSLQRRVLPSMRRFKELGATTSDPQEPKQIDKQPTLPPTPEQ